MHRRVSLVPTVLVVLLSVSGCEDRDPTGPSQWATYTEASIYADGDRILRIRRDSPGNNEWRFSPNPETGSRPLEGDDAPSLVDLRVTTWPESATMGGDWMTVELRSRGVPLPVATGAYPVAFVGPEEELEISHLGSFTGTLRMGAGIGSLSRRGQAVSGELEILKVAPDPRQRRRILMEGRIHAEFQEVGEDGQPLPATLAAVIEFRVVYPQVI